MNFLVGFLLTINNGNEEEIFWFLKSMLESSDYFMTGMFEVNLILVFCF
jgi:hypothetical protein